MLGRFDSGSPSLDRLQIKALFGWVELLALRPIHMYGLGPCVWLQLGNSTLRFVLWMR